MSALSKSRAVTVKREDCRRLDEETKIMQAKLELLKKTLDATAAEAPKGAGTDGSRWRSGSASKPLTRGYVKGVLDATKVAGVRPRPPGAPRDAPSGESRSGAATPSAHVTEGTVAELLATGPQPENEGCAGGGSRAAGNLCAAMQRQSEEAQEVENFLGNLKLDRYVSIFMESGLDSMDVVLDMQESHMREIGMAVGHVLKLQKAIAERRPGGSGSERKVSFSPADTSGDRPGGSSGPGPAASPEALGTTSKASSNCLAEGNFDEAESAASFQEALKAWREGRPEGAEQPKRAPGSFWSSVGGADVDLARCSTPVRPPTQAETLDGQTQREGAPSEDKICCYNCFKQFYNHFAVERCVPAGVPQTPGGTGASTRRLLCSEACAEKWLAALEEKASAQRQRQEKMEALREAERALEEQMQERPPAQLQAVQATA